MFEKLFDRFRSKPATPTIAKPVTGAAIYAYVQNLWNGDRDRFDDEIRNRGLSFGDLLLKDSWAHPKFILPNAKIGAITMEEIGSILAEIVAEQQLDGVISATSHDGISLELTPTSKLQGLSQSGWSSERGSFQRRLFLEVTRLSTFPFEVTAYGPEATDVVLLLAQKLALVTEPAMYSYESAVPISEIVDYAFHWHDAKTGKHYVETKFDPANVKSEVYIGGGWNKSYEDGDKKIVVLASDHQPQLKLNNVIIKPKNTVWPMAMMEATRAYIRSQTRRVCGIDGCTKDVSVEISVTRGEMSDGFGTSSFGSVYGVCDDPAHLTQRKQNLRGVRITERPAREENW